MSSSSSSPVVAVPVFEPTVSIKLRPSKERGHANHGWLNSYHTFSFAGYYDEEFPGYHSLRVINEDRVSGGNGFPTHPHREYEIFSYIVNGSLKHNDSLGNQEILSRGDVQFTSAGRGIAHSEYNASNKDLVHFIQIWVKPNISQLTPSYQTASFSDSQKLGKLCLIVGRDQDKKEEPGNQGIITIHQDFKMYASLLRDNESVSYTLEPGRALYVHVIQDVTGFAKEGNACGLRLNHSHLLGSGDGAFIEFPSNESEAAVSLTFQGNKKAGSSTSEAPTEFILFDVKKENEKYR